jgi:hypothetical protein
MLGAKLMKLLVCAIITAILLSIVAPVAAGDKKAALNDTPDWLQLSQLWRRMSAHWAGKTADRIAFKDLGHEIDASLYSLTRLENAGYFTRAMKLTLEELFKTRYKFIDDSRYHPTAEISVTNLDNHSFTARTNIEMRLAWLLWPEEIPNLQVGEVREKARKDLLRELEFLSRAAALRAQIEAHRAEAKKKEADGEKVNWDQFTLESLWRTRELIDGYLAKKLKPGKETLQLQRHVLSLTEDPLPPHIAEG